MWQNGAFVDVHDGSWTSSLLKRASKTLVGSFWSKEIFKGKPPISTDSSQIPYKTPPVCLGPIESATGRWALMRPAAEVSQRGSIGDFTQWNAPVESMGQVDWGIRWLFFVVSLWSFRSFRSFLLQSKLMFFCFNVTSVIGLYFD